MCEEPLRSNYNLFSPCARSGTAPSASAWSTSRSGWRCANAAVGHLVPDAAPRVRDADQAEALVPRARARRRAGRARQGLGGREGRVRDRRGGRSRGGRAPALAVDRDPRASSSSRRSTPSTSTARTTSRRRAAEAQRRPYVLLLRAMPDTGMAAIGKFVLWGKENLCLIRPHGDSLALETLFFAEDVRSQAEIEEAVAETRCKPAELDLAQQVIGSLVGEFDARGLRERVPARAAHDARGEGGRAGDRRARSRCRRRRSSTSWRRSAAASGAGARRREAEGRAQEAGGASRRRAPARKSRLAG